MSATNSRPTRERLLIDRCMSPSLAPPLQRLYQIPTATLAEVFGDDRAPTLPDVDWIEYCGRNGVVALTKNVDIWKVPAELAAIRKYGARIITMKANVTRLESAMIAGQNISLIRRELKATGPGFVQISSGSPTRRVV